MKLTISLFLAVLLTFNSLVFATPKREQTKKIFEPSEKSWKSADKLLKKMSVEEKVGQIIQIGINARFINQESDFFQDLKRHVTENKIGGVIFFGAPMYETVHLGNRLQENAEIPLLFALDAETGVGMRFMDAANFPWNMAVAATGNTEYAYKMGVVTGRESKAMGMMQVYAPVLDVNNNADNPVINVRSYGEDPETVARFGAAFIEGVQSQGVIATAKHFPGHGDTNVDSHRGLPIINVSRERLDQLELVPFRRAIESGVASIMVAHIGLPQIDPTEIKPIPNAIRLDTEEEVITENATIPATLSSKIQTDLLRRDLGFKGLIVSDAMSMSGLTLYVTQEEAGVQAFLAGADLLEKPADTDAMIRGLRNAVKSGRISETRLDESVRKILAWKHELGLFKQKITPIDQMDRIISNKATYALAEEIANKAVTLVRNEENLIPLDKSQKIFVLGVSNGFDGENTSAALTNLLRANGVKFGSVVLQENSSPETIARARDGAAKADIVIAAMYGRVRSGAKNSVGLPDSGVAILRDLLAKNKKVIGLSFGNPYILQSFPTLKTYVVAYGDMTPLQRASGRTMLGLLETNGKLPITLPGLVPRGTGLSLKK
jgi:beta-N-acetylhexosaminidase